MNFFFGLITPSQSESLLSKAVVFASVASIGGIFVLVGLLLEKGKEKERFSSIKDFRLQKAKAEWGSWILIFGIVIEIGTGAALTWMEVSESIDAANRMAQIDPINRPISEISAIVDFKVKEDKPSETAHWGAASVAGILLCETNLMAGNEFVGFSQIGFLNAPSFDRYFDGTKLEYVLHFHFDEFSTLFAHGRNRSVKWALENIRFLDITTKFLPHDAEILEGSAVVIINSGSEIWFDIPKQKDLQPTSGSYGYGYQIIASKPKSTNIVLTPNKP
jgi:hypothetical protein